MKKVVPPPKPVRWYAPDQKAEARLLALGAKPKHLYRGWTAVEALGKWHMRAGEFLGVVDGLRAFGKTRRPIAKAVDMIHGWGATIVDVETGKDSCRHGVTMLNDALDPPKPSAEFLARLRAERTEAWRTKKGVMPKREATIIWRDPKFSVDEALAEMDGWTKSQAYNELGRRDVPAGRRPKKKQE